MRSGGASSALDLERLRASGLVADTQQGAAASHGSYLSPFLASGAPAPGLSELDDETALAAASAAAAVLGDGTDAGACALVT